MIHLVNAPFGSIMRAPLALGLIKAQLAGAGIPARVHHLNFLFARVLGFGAYETIARFKGVETQVGEWLFADAAWQRPFGDDEEAFLRLCGDELETIPNVPDPVAWLRTIRRDSVDAFLEKAYQRLTQHGPPRIVGFSCMFFQTVAALALGRMLKARHPSVTLVYGGACFHGEAGEELIAKVPWIDVVATGEADQAIVPLFAALTRGEPPPALPGLRFRDRRRGGLVAGPPPVNTSPATLAALPDPDYAEFFDDAAEVGLTADPAWIDRASLPFEASRGCWWGQKKHCTFCGLNGAGLDFRARPPGDVLATLRGFAARYPLRNYQATDNIMAMSYFDSFLPDLAAAPIEVGGRRAELFFEIKPNLTRAQIERLAAAGVAYVQPGIESLSTHLLRVVDKGVTGLQNLFFLKCATEYGLLPIWNLLVRIPDEAAEDYAEMAALIPRITHLRPPTGGAVRVECHRYSPYFDRDGEFLADRRPARWYRSIYPEDQIALDRVAYYFDATWKRTLGGDAYDRVTARAHAWMAQWRATQVPRLTMREVAGGLALEDSRAGAPVQHRLVGRRAAIYRGLDDITTVERLLARLHAAGDPCAPDELRAELDALVAEGLAVRERERYLGLALPPFHEIPLDRRLAQRATNQRPVGAPRRLPIIAT